MSVRIDSNADSSDDEELPRTGRDTRSFLLWIFLFLFLAVCLGIAWAALRRTAETVLPQGTGINRSAPSAAR